MQARCYAAEIAYCYAPEAGLALGEAFLAEVDATLERMAAHPATGAHRHAGCAPDLPAALRFVPLKRFEHHLVYYIGLPDCVEIIRIWHSARGLAALLETPR
ncbi:plasmid stabilization protein [Lysobacteraceae bacterium NML07-0707]|nr:plasmid stabilization protein [Xanthomonadaceae bacterium NML07-0707]